MNLPARYHAFIDWIGDGTGLPDTILHIHAGMAVLLIARVVTGRSLATPVPFLCVAAAEAFNEVMDRLHFGSWRTGDTTMDIANTLFWPAVLMIGLRLRRARATRSYWEAAGALGRRWCGTAESPGSQQQ